MAVETLDQEPSTAPPAPAEAQGQAKTQEQEQEQEQTHSSLRTIDFTSNTPLRQASTMLRRVWLLDPPLSHEELADPATVQECFRAMCEAIGNGITADGDESKWDHELWRKHTQLKLLGDPVVTAAPAEPGDLCSVVSPWREEIYDIYRHVFSDLWRALVQQAAAAGEHTGQLGRYDPGKSDAVSLVVLPAEEKTKADTTAFTTDTFLYPVFVHPRAKVTFAAAAGGGAEEHVWVAGEEKTWTTGLWVRAGRDVLLTTEVAAMDGKKGEEGRKDGAEIAAVFVTGHCEARGGGEPSVGKAAAEGDTAPPAEAAASGS